MNNIYNYKQFNEEIIVNQIIEYIDYSINESADIKSIWNNVIDKIKGLSKSAKRKVLKYTIGSLLLFNTITNVIQIINSSNASPEDKEVAIEICEEKKEKYKPGYDFVLSQAGWNHIKNEEKLRLKAYKIGDGMITVGYGHAEKISKTKLKVGQSITQNKADEYLREDLKESADGVRRMFKDWESEGFNIEITQSMFDALVSIAYNAGVSGLRNSEVVQHLKRGDYKMTADSIKTFKISPKFPGLAIRREKESEMFLASI